tara:strand:- start:904 stop:1239 length:336 start_codon:yes stop_codon:yes gene_type:complete
MTKAIEVNRVHVIGENKKGDPIFEAKGTLNEKPFVARTIQWKGEPIFKLQETNEEGELAHLVMAGSSFSRGDRIAVARACKAARLAQFGSGAKEQVEPELEAGETVELAAK